MEKKLTFNNEADNTRGKKKKKIFQSWWVQTIQGSECEVGLETAPSPLHPGGCEGSCALDRRLNAALGAAGQAQVLKQAKMHMWVDLQGMI